MPSLGQRSLRIFSEVATPNDFAYYLPVSAFINGYFDLSELKNIDIEAMHLVSIPRWLLAAL